MSLSVSVTTGNGANASPSGMKRTWSATNFAAWRYFATSAGDTASDSPVLSNPAALAGSTGKSRAGRMSTPVRSRTVASYSAFERRRGSTTPGSPALRSASRVRNASIHATTAWRCAAVGWVFAVRGGISPDLSCVSTSSHCAKSAATDAGVVKRRRFRSAFGRSAPWQLPQFASRNGRTVSRNWASRSGAGCASATGALGRGARSTVAAASAASPDR